MGCIALLPVNTSVLKDVSDDEECFNGLHCPTPCKHQWLFFRSDLIAVSMGCIALLPVNPLRTEIMHAIVNVSMGCIALLPVNIAICINNILLVSMGCIALLPVN